MKTAYLGAALVLTVGAYATGVVTPASETQPSNAASGSSAGRYASADGRVAFSYPADWHVQDHWPEETSFVTSFVLGSRCCSMLDGDVKIDFFTEPASAATASQLARERCDGFTQSCEIVQIDGRDWVWTSEQDSSEGLTSILSAATVDAGSVFNAIAIVPAGPHHDAGLAAVERILRSFRIR